MPAYVFAVCFLYGNYVYFLLYCAFFLVVIPYPAPLPTFSSMLHDVLASDEIHKDINWRQFILESSFFYFGHLPLAEGPARISYVNIGRTMYEKYPSISAKGTTPWVCICFHYWQICVICKHLMASGIHKYISLEEYWHIYHCWIVRTLCGKPGT